MSQAWQASDWPHGDGEMAALVRAYPWATTPLGPIEAWPERLKAVVDLVLASPLVSTLACGPERVLLYNDAAARLYEGRHPHVLGRSLARAFPDAYPAVAPLYDRAFAGEAVQVPAQPLDVSRAGGEVFEAHLTPVRGGDGAVIAVHMTGLEVSARLRTETELRASEERLRAVLETARDYAIFTTTSEGRIDAWHAGAEAVFGWTAAEAIGQSVDELFTPEDRAAGAPAAERDQARREGLAPDVRWHLRGNGGRVFIEGVARRMDGPGGAPSGFLKIGRDATERRAAEAGLRDSEERFRRFADASSDVLWIRDARTMQFEYVSSAFEAVYGDRFERVLGGNDLRRWAKLILPEDRGDVMDAFRRVRAGKRVTHEFRIRRRSDGQVRWIRDTDFPLLDEDGRVQRVAGIGHDATDEKQAETALRDSGERLQVLVNELQHRGRNLLGVVRSVASKTVGQGGSVESFEDRLAALSRAQGQLSRFGSDHVELEALVRAELEAHVDVGPPKVVLHGPRVVLTFEQVQTFALALHELVTNAVKYGALRDEGGPGRLAVTWVVAHGGGAGGGRTGGAEGDSRLLLDWVESGVDVPRERVARRGFGRDLIENALAYSLGAHTSYDLGPDGVRCRIELPLR